MLHHRFARIAGSLLTLLAVQAVAAPEETPVDVTPAPTSTEAPAVVAHSEAPAEEIKTPFITQLPNFSELKIDNYLANIDNAILECNHKIAAALKQPPTWNNTVQPIMEQVAKVKAAWNLLIILNTVAQTEQTTHTLNSLLPKIAQFHNNIMHNHDLYQAYLTIAKSKDFALLTPTQQITITQTIQDFKLNGADLNQMQQQRYFQIIQRLRDLGKQYLHNLSEATDTWQYFIPATDAHRMDGLPDFIKTQAANIAQAQGKSGWVITLNDACLIAVESYAKDRKLREIVYTAFATLASAQDQDPVRRKWDNTDTIAETLKLRQELGKLLGFNNYAEYAVADRQPPDPAQALQFLEDLASKIKPAAKKEFSALQAFAKQDNVTDLKAWDIAYYAQWNKAILAGDSQKKSKEYFRTHLLTQSFFNLASILFNINFTEVKDASTWHPDVKLYNIVDVENKPIAYVYLDLYARDGKNPNNRTQMYTTRINAATPILPVAVISTNLRTDANDLLSHDAVVKLFSEFGEMLQRCLATLDYPNFSGNNGMTWDAIALSSQFMQYWAWQKDYLMDITASYKTGAKIPDNLIATLTKVNNFDAAINMLQQLQLAMLDLRMHLNLPTDAGKSVQEIFLDIRNKYDILPNAAVDMFPNRFTESFTTDFASTYFTYYWDQSLAADAFGTFLENGIFSAKIGHKFRDTLLEQGGQTSVEDLFLKFRDRGPQLNYLLTLSEIQTK